MAKITMFNLKLTSYLILVHTNTAQPAILSFTQFNSINPPLIILITTKTLKTCCEIPPADKTWFLLELTISRFNLFVCPKIIVDVLH